MSSLHRLALRVVALLFFFGLGVAAAQPAANDVESTRLDQAAATLKQIYSTLQQPDLSKSDLEKLQAAAGPVTDQIRLTLDDLSPREEALKAQLVQLGPAPGPKGPPESPQVAAERVKRQQAYNNVDALVKRANLLAVQAEQVNARVIQRRRARLAQRLFTAGPSIGTPRLWIDAISELPQDVATAKAKIVTWVKDAAAKLSGLLALAFWAAIALIVVLYRVAVWVARRAWTARVGAPSLYKILAAWREAVVVGALPVAAAAAIGAVAALLGVVDPSDPLPRALFLGVVRIAVVAGVARGLLAPEQQERRLVTLDDATAARVLRTALLLWA